MGAAHQLPLLQVLVSSLVLLLPHPHPTHKGTFVHAKLYSVASAIGISFLYHFKITNSYIINYYYVQYMYVYMVVVNAECMYSYMYVHVYCAWKESIRGICLVKITFAIC